MIKVKVGEKAPDWSAKNQNNETVQSSDFRGKKLALYFYPKDQTPGCINQACNLRDHFEELKKHQIEILGVSPDGEKSHLRFIEKQSIPFPLLVDEDKKLIDLFGVWGPKKFMGRTYDGLHRTTFLINEEGIIQEIITKPKTKAHAEEILQGFEIK